MLRRNDNSVPEPFISESELSLNPVARVRSSLKSRAAAPKQASEGAPPAELVFEPCYAPAIAHLQPGAEIWILTWLDRADRSVLAVHPRGKRNLPLTGVFATRSPDRPNPIGLHRAKVLSREGLVLRVDALEAIDGTPILDIKPASECEPA